MINKLERGLIREVEYNGINTDTILHLPFSGKEHHSARRPRILSFSHTSLINSVKVRSSYQLSIN